MSVSRVRASLRGAVRGGARLRRTTHRMLTAAGGCSGSQHGRIIMAEPLVGARASVVGVRTAASCARRRSMKDTSPAESLL